MHLANLLSSVLFFVEFLENIVYKFKCRMPSPEIANTKREGHTAENYNKLIKGHSSIKYNDKQTLVKHHLHS